MVENSPVKRGLKIRGQGTICVLPRLEFNEHDKITTSVFGKDEGISLEVNMSSFEISIYLNTVDETGSSRVNIIVDNDPSHCVTINHERQPWYWFSIDSKRMIVYYGRGEQSVSAALITLSLTHLPAVHKFVKTVTHYSVSGPVIKRKVQGLPVYKHPIFIVDRDKITPEMIARGEVTTIRDFRREIQILYEYISGAMFKLDTDDFPEFTNAIEVSINTPGYICYEKLKEKTGEFGDSDPKETYLRVTLGENLSNSPGIPFVMEIWPVGHYSPIHQHSKANALIRVMRGMVTAQLYSDLSIDHQTPHTKQLLTEGLLTWLNKDFNQTHKLFNNKGTTAAITLQCYRYDDDDRTHYEYFDYIDEKSRQIKPWEPNSDFEYIDFKQRIKQEWLKNSESN